MNESGTTNQHPDRDEVAPASERKPYVAPTLERRGDLARLTAISLSKI